MLWFSGLPVAMMPFNSKLYGKQGKREKSNYNMHIKWARACGGSSVPQSLWASYMNLKIVPHLHQGNIGCVAVFWHNAKCKCKSWTFFSAQCLLARLHLHLNYLKVNQHNTTILGSPKTRTAFGHQNYISLI